MSRGTDRSITHWLRASRPGGGVCASSADHPSYGPGFRAAHERAGYTVTRHSLDELRAEHEARAAQRRTPVLQAEPEPEVVLPAELPELPTIGASIEVKRGPGMVLAHLTFPAGHAYAGQRAALTRFRDGEGLVWPGEGILVSPELPEAEPLPPPQFVEVLVTPAGAYFQPGLF